MAELETTKYSARVEWGGGLTNMGREEISLFMFVNIVFHSSFPLKTSVPFNNLNNDLDFSTSFDKNGERAANFSLRCCTSFKQLKLLMVVMTSHLSLFFLFLYGWSWTRGFFLFQPQKGTSQGWVTYYVILLSQRPFSDVRHDFRLYLISSPCHQCRPP